MAVTRAIQVGELTVTLRELSFEEVRQWVSDLEAGDGVVDVAGEFAFDDISLRELALMSDATEASLRAFAPSELEPLRAAGRRLNPHFFRTRAAVIRVLQATLARLDSPSQTSTAARSR